MCLSWYTKLLSLVSFGYNRGNGRGVVTNWISLFWYIKLVFHKVPQNHDEFNKMFEPKTWIWHLGTLWSISWHEMQALAYCIDLRYIFSMHEVFEWFNIKIIPEKKLNYQLFRRPTHICNFSIWNGQLYLFAGKIS